jgi:hypothetical protein
MIKKVVRFTALLTVDDDKALRALCDQNNCSKGEVLRRGIRSLYAMEILCQPTCASGLKCFVPHYHINMQGQLPMAPPPPPAQ